MKTGLQKRINRAVGKAIHDWDMILENDRILVGLSGGKDSQALLEILVALQKKAPIRFELLPVHIDAGFEGSFAKDLEYYVENAYGDIKIEYKDYGVLAHSDENRSNPCFLCSWLRRKRLFEIAQEQGCKKIALGHNKDDIIETLFINICYAGKIGTMKPRQAFFNGAIDIIRPLSYVDKEDIIRFGQLFDLPEFKNNCPSANQTKRSEIKNLLETLYKHNKHIKGNIFRAMSNVALDYLLENKNDRHSKST
ncbi:tRNA 2-thiocytidine(32) synthetase TtcA [Desulfobacula toluolica]|uniref:TtcA: tRNA 2-thiocytidine biosynthesis protein n=1 Tax=Desulfobacula toluolica (strain DSM 7467 / Tol2) TaxID=651182 RepID=K0NEP7_DESTT|nr:tRNA 2-thiocytidine(32) synthetase TtcA [Desulfobacula toluolica]CCK79536.1 TtcA: tRNA 2-thiocytidine biosynthesis protein [Desulfobacula toluolica Tol2]